MYTHVGLATASLILVAVLVLLCKQEGQHAVHACTLQAQCSQVEGGAVDHDEVLIVHGHLVRLLAAAPAHHLLSQQQAKYAVHCDAAAALVLAVMLQTGGGGRGTEANTHTHTHEACETATITSDIG